MTSGSEGMRGRGRGGAKSWRRERGFHPVKSETSAILNSVKGRQDSKAMPGAGLGVSPAARLM